MQRRRLISADTLAPWLPALPALAQRPAPVLPATLKYVVPFAAGGLTDVMARIAARQLAAGLVEMTHVPYRGGALSITDLMGGHLDVIFSNFPESIAHVISGKLRALALCSAQRHPQLPNVPTTAEAGMPRLLVENWTAAMVQAKTPDAIVDRYERELVKLMFTPEIEERARALGFLPKPMGRDAFGSFLGSEIERWAKLIRAAKISVT